MATPCTPERAPQRTCGPLGSPGLYERMAAQAGTFEPYRGYIGRALRVWDERMEDVINWMEPTIPEHKAVRNKAPGGLSRRVQADNAQSARAAEIEAFKRRCAEQRNQRQMEQQRQLAAKCSRVQQARRCRSAPTTQYDRNTFAEESCDDGSYDDEEDDCAGPSMDERFDAQIQRIQEIARPSCDNQWEDSQETITSNYDCDDQEEPFLWDYWRPGRPCTPPPVLPETSGSSSFNSSFGSDAPGTEFIESIYEGDSAREQSVCEEPAECQPQCRPQQPARKQAAMAAKKADICAFKRQCDLQKQQRQALQAQQLRENQERVARARAAKCQRKAAPAPNCRPRGGYDADDFKPCAGYSLYCFN